MFDLTACNPSGGGTVSGRGRARIGVVSAAGIAGEVRLAMLHLRPLATDADVRELVLSPDHAVAVDGLRLRLSCVCGSTISTCR